MKIEQYIITDKIKITFVDTGYTIEVDGEKHEGNLSDYDDRECMIQGALEETAILAAEFYEDVDEDFTFHDEVVLPAIDALEAKLIS